MVKNCLFCNRWIFSPWTRLVPLRLDALTYFSSLFRSVGLFFILVAVEINYHVLITRITVILHAIKARWIAASAWICLNYSTLDRKL
jgi:hypothetical protein